MAEIVEQVQEREAAHVSLCTVFSSYFGHLFEPVSITFSLAILGKRRALPAS